MYTGNKEYFALKRQLVDEAKVKINQLPTERSIQYRDSYDQPLGLTFVYEWSDNGIDILGYGCNSAGDACCIRPQVEPGLFVVTSDHCILRHVCAIYGYEVEVYDIEYESNNFYVWELMSDYNRSAPCKLAKIITKSVANAERLYNKFKYNTMSYKYVGISQYFNVGTQIMFEMILNRNAKQRQENYLKKLPQPPFDYSVPKTTMVWFDESLNVYTQYKAPEVPIIFFDIETVSSDPHRVPRGDACDDILFTVSIHHSHTNKLYTLIYLPLPMAPKDMEKLIRNDGYDVIPDKSVDATNCENILECFASERSLLQRTMELLTLRPKLHILYGYNSLGYDIKYLLTRCAFFKIELEHFVWREGYSFGVEQMHLDLFRIIIMRYRFKSYKLDDVSREILKDSKTGVSAVNLRYTFFTMVKYRKYHKLKNSCDFKPSIRATLEYNNADTLLVAKLESRTKCIPFLTQRAADCQVPLSSMNTNYNKMQYKLWSECFVVGLELRIFLTTFKSPQISIKCPITNPPHNYDLIDIRLDLSENLNSTASDIQTPNTKRYEQTAVKKAKFPGGANFCFGEINADNVQMYDYVTAYPILMDRKNISDETTTILPASILIMLYPYIPNIKTFKTYDYMAHNGSSKSETIILYYQYVYDGLYCGGEFPFTYEELLKRHDSPVIVIWEGRRGVLSRIIAHFSAVRAQTKLKRKTLDEIYDILIDKKNDLTAQKILMDQCMDDDDEYIEEDDHTTLAFQNKRICLSEDETFGLEDDDDNNNNTDDETNNNANEIFGFDDDDDEENEDNNNNNNNENDDVFGLDDDDDNNNIEKENILNNEMFGFDDDDDNDENANNDIDTATNNAEDNIDFGFEDDDDDDNCNDNTEENENITTTTSTQIEKTTSGDNMFSQLPENVSRILKMYGTMCAIDDVELKKEADPLNTISNIAELIALERNNTSNSYDLQKNIVASIYGCVGKMSTVVAATITSMTRCTLLASAQYCRSLGHKVLYIDTDSIMIVGCNEDLSTKLNSLFPYMEMEMKYARKCLFVKRKTYYKVEDGNFKYGQNVNGPHAWRECVEFFFERDTIKTNPDIYQAFYDFYMQVYKRLLTYKTVTPEFLKHFTQTIKTKDEYKTMTVAHRFKMYLGDKYPALVGATKHSIYYYLDNSVLLPCLRPELDIKSVDDLKYVNLFKYYQNMFTTIFNLIKFNIRKNNQPHNVTLSSKYVLLLMVKAFLDVYSEIFASDLSESQKLKITETTEAEDVFTEPIHTEVLNGTDDIDDL